MGEDKTLKPLPQAACRCQAAAREQAAKPTAQRRVIIYHGLGLLGLGLWFAAYQQLKALSGILTLEALGLVPGTRLEKAVGFFLYDTPKVLMLLALIVFLVGVLRSFFSPHRTRRLLAGKRQFTGNVLAAPILKAAYRLVRE